jgi:hypothetical protein
MLAAGATYLAALRGKLNRNFVAGLAIWTFQDHRVSRSSSGGADADCETLLLSTWFHYRPKCVDTADAVQHKGLMFNAVYTPGQF